MRKVIIVSRNFGFPGGVVYFVNLLLKQLNKTNIETYHITVGKSPNKALNILLPILILFQIMKYNILLKKKKPDVVHLNPSFGTVPMLRDGIFLRIAKRYKISVLYLIHGWEDKFYEKLKGNIGLFSNFYMRSLKRSDGIAVLAKDFKNKLIDVGLDKNNIYVVGTMVESEKYHPDNKDFKNPNQILFCSRLIKEKGPYELLDAAKIVLKKNSEIRFIFMGDGKEINGLRLYSNKLGINNNVHFTGYLKGKKKYQVFRQSHLFVLPSYTEGLPIVILEAMAAGLVLLATPVGGIKDILKSGKNGLIISSMPPDPKEISEKLNYLLENPNYLKKVSKNNIKDVTDKYDSEVVTTQITKLYHKLLVTN
jgi:glycosyltransferase involved in cell wall biosynthesis